MRAGWGVLLLVVVGCSVKPGRVGERKTLYLENQSRHSVPEIEVPPTALYTEFLGEKEAVDLDRRIAESDRRLAELMSILHNEQAYAHGMSYLIARKSA